MIPGLQKTVNISTISITGNCNTKQMHLTSSFMKCKKQYLCKNIIFMNFYLSVIKLILHVTTALSAPIPSTTQTADQFRQLHCVQHYCIVCSNCTWIIKKSHTICQITSRKNPSLTVLNPLTPKITLVILLIVCHIVLVMLVWRICYWIYLQSPKWYSHHLSAWYCNDIVRRNSVWSLMVVKGLM